MPRPTTTARRELGGELRRLRGERRGATVAAALGWSESKLSRIETARTGIRDADLDRLLAAYGVTGDDRVRLQDLARRGRARVWWNAYRSAVPDPYDEYVALEAEAAVLREWEAQVIPGLLQTDEYARAVIEVGADRTDPETVQRRVALRMARQAVLTREAPPRLCVVLDEAVLHRRVGGSAVMRRQLHRLHDACGRPGIEVRVLPFAAGAHAALAGSFMVFEFGVPGRSDVAHVEDATGGVFRDRPAEVQMYRRFFTDVWQRALDPVASRDLVARTGEGLD
ncbi:helix-turn-helix protein [Krasilnikovia cinnamomea]|uniref:Helix-turn-helix protein n=1 Tax=Krasilnikovia cinnamomea TaxID=349313 RepID=A0A4Q7ZNW5_9ACTN|nr:helix-turn-helix transcriptional regulator [Krasilnikovia cinnamomea]RZU52193.1 helix-turn-helix protein [Krasilnikovia cinnamomea]